jgi:hypothetical protein
MSAELNIPAEALNVGWHEFRYPRPATDEPSAAFKRGLDAAMPLIVADAMERMAEKIWQEFGVDNEDDESYVSGIDDVVVKLRTEATRLRGGR